MRKFLIAIIVILVLLIGTALALPSLIPSEVYKEKIQTQLTKELEREVIINGDVKLSVFPVIRAKTDGVIIRNPEGYTAENFASMDRLEARVRLVPLLSKRVEIAAFELINPEINLEKRADGEANWVFGEDPASEPAEDNGPFKRDGRYSDIDPSIGKFALENGAISYADRMSGEAFNITDANLSFSLPSLDQKVSIKGDLVADARPVTIDLMLDTPRSFLAGARTPVEIFAETEFAKIDAKGAFLESEDIAFDLSLDGAVSDFEALKAYLPEDVPVAELVSEASLKGNYIFDGKVLSAKGADITAKGGRLNASYKGDAVLSETPVFTGRASLDAREPAALAALLGQDIQGLDVLDSVKLTADLAARGEGFDASNIDAAVKGANLDATFKGAGSFAEAVSANGRFTAKSGSVSALVKALDLDVPQAAAIGSADASGTLTLEGENIDIIFDKAETAGQYVSGTYKGRAALRGEALSLDGIFAADAASVPALVQAAKLDMPQAAALGSVDLAGNLAMNGDAINVTFTQAGTRGDYITGTYAGTASIVGESVNLNGNFDADVRSLIELSKAIGSDIPYAASIGAIKAKGVISGAADDLSISGLEATLSGGQLNGKFTGSATVSEAFNIDGNLVADIPSVRALATTNGTQLPPNTDAGQIFENFKISGDVAGDPSKINFTGASITLDKINGTGDFTANMTGAKPFLTGTLALDGLDLRPYMASYATQNPSGEIQPWSEEELDLGALKSVDGDFKFTTPNVITDRVKMGQSTIDATLRNGKLAANMPRVPLYGGLGKLNMSLDASGAVPQVALKLDMDDLNSNNFLSAVAGFTKASGQGSTLLDIKGSGRTQAEIMRSLNGQGDFSILNGQLQGIDLKQFVSGVDQFFVSRSLPGGIGSEYTTKFQDIAGLFKIQNGVATIDNFNLQGYGVAAQGVGKIDLGGQNIDFSLRPRLTGESASNLAKFGIPVKLSGGFGNVKAGLDTEFVGQILAAQARSRVQREITGSVGGPAGDILGGILGGQSGNQGTGNPGSGNQGTPEEAIGNVLGGILGGQQNQPQNPAGSGDPQTQEKAEEPTPEDLILDLFGGGKKKKSDNGGN